MTTLSVIDYKAALVSRLGQIFGDVPVDTDWAPLIRDQKFADNPRPDIAVGPFSFGDHVLVQQYNYMVEAKQELLLQMFRSYSSNLEEGFEVAGTWDFYDLCYQNQDPRCFLALWIEKKVSSKVSMKGMVNAASLGRLGVAVVRTPEQLRLFLALRNSIFANFGYRNLLVLTAEQVADIWNIS